MMFRFPSVICTRCTGFFCLAIIKGSPNDIYCIIEEPYKHYFTEKVSYSPSSFSRIDAFNSAREKNCSLRTAAIIHVNIIPTDSSTFGLSLGLRTLAGRMARLSLVPVMEMFGILYHRKYLSYTFLISRI